MSRMLNFEIHGHYFRVAVHKHVTVFYVKMGKSFTKRAEFPTWNFSRMTRMGYYRRLNSSPSYIVLDMETIKRVAADYAPTLVDLPL